MRSHSDRSPEIVARNQAVFQAFIDGDIYPEIAERHQISKNLVAQIIHDERRRRRLAARAAKDAAALER